MATLHFSVFCGPDIEGLRRVYALPCDLADDEVAEYAWQRSRAAGLGDTLSPCLQRIVSIACVRDKAGHFELFSLSGDEANILARFYALADVADDLMSCGIPGLPALEPEYVLQSRAVLHQVAAQKRPVFQCLGRTLFGAQAHTDKGAGLETIAVLAGLPGVQPLLAQACWRKIRDADTSQIEALNEVRVLVQYVLGLRQRVLWGETSPPECLAESARLRRWLQNSSSAHLQTCLQDWPAAF
jgi:hypothetical protein